MEAIQGILIHQTYMMRNSTLGPYIPPSFSPPRYMEVVNALFYASLGLMFLAAFLAMLIKSWIREFDRGLRGLSIPEQRAKTREFRYQGSLNWKLQELVAVLPFLIQISLLLFFLGLALFLYQITALSCGIITSILGIGVLFYATTTTISIFVTSSPFRSPLSRAIGALYQRIFSILCPSTTEFFSESLDTPPTLSLQSLRRRFQFYLGKLRPYREDDFVEAFTDVPGDPVQFRVSASALEWLHNNAPDSYHSEGLHWTVWRTMGAAAFREPLLIKMPQWLEHQSRSLVYLRRFPHTSLRALCTVLLHCDHSSDFTGQVLISQLKLSPDPWDHLVARLCSALFPDMARLLKGEPLHEIADTIRSNSFNVDQLLWITEILSNHCLKSVVTQFYDVRAYLNICGAVLWAQAKILGALSSPASSDNAKDAILVDASIALAAIVLLSGDQRPQMQSILTQRRRRPWMLPALRSEDLITQLAEAVRTPGRDRDFTLFAKHFFFLIPLYLIRRGSHQLTLRYARIIKGNDQLVSWSRVLSASVPAMTFLECASMIGLFMTPEIGSYSTGSPTRHGSTFIVQIFQEYDIMLGGMEDPDPNILVALAYHGLPISWSKKDIGDWFHSNPPRNPWWALAVRAITGLETSSTHPALPQSCENPRVLDIIAAASLRRYEDRNWRPERPGNGLLALFMQSREYAIASIALKYYVQEIGAMTFIPENASGASGPSAAPLPPRHLPNAVQIIFSPCVETHQLAEGWMILDSIMRLWPVLSSAWRRVFAMAFFTVSSQQRPRRRGDPYRNTPYDQLNNIITVEYVEDFVLLQWPVVGDGLDWMVVLWEMWSKEIPGRQEEMPESNITGQLGAGTGRMAPGVLKILSNLVMATPETVIGPLIPRIRQFVYTCQPDDGVTRDEVLTRLQLVSATRQTYGRFSCTLYL